MMRGRKGCRINMEDGKVELCICMRTCVSEEKENR